LKFFIIFIIFFNSLVYANEEYILGEGYQVGSLPIYVGGYFSVDYRKKDEEDRYRIDDLSFMSYGGDEKLSYLVELEFKELYVKTVNNETTTIQRDKKLHTERLYLKYSIDESYDIRLGKYNSPVGFWNLMPINVLRETTSSPILNEIIYPKYTTGLNLEYNSYELGEIKLDLIVQNNTPIDDEYNNYDINKHYALGFSYEEDEYSIKINAGFFSKRVIYNDIKDFTYALIGAKYDTENYQFLAEIAMQDSQKQDRNYAGYIQGLYRFTHKHIATIRLESYKDELLQNDDNMAIFAYTYRMLYPVALKMEYQQHTNSNQNQIIFSFSVLF
jgi:hypothetical protein